MIRTNYVLFQNKVSDRLPVLSGDHQSWVVHVHHVACVDDPLRYVENYMCLCINKNKECNTTKLLTETS